MNNNESLVISINEQKIIADDISSIEYIKKLNFIKVNNIGVLLEKGLPKIEELGYSGCYVIIKPENYIPLFYTPAEAIDKGNVIRPWAIEKLQPKWVNDADVIYFGIAGIKSNRSLKSRLNDLINHGNGRTTDRGPHKGGEIFWQLKDYEKFSLWILPMSMPRVEEVDYLKKFLHLKGKLPFANRQI